MRLHEADCYTQESTGTSSLRNGCNKSYGHHIKTVASTQPDGSLPDMKLYYWDVRFSSICNLKCRMCYPTCSILIEKEFNKIQKTEPGWHKLSFGPGSSDIMHDKYFLETIKNFENIEVLRFSGGEPFLNEHLKEIFYKALIVLSFHNKLQYKEHNKNYHHI